MKTTGALILITLIAAITFGCNKTTSKVTPQVPVVTGKWYLKKLDDAYYVYTILAHTDSTIYYADTNYIQLNNDGTGYISGDFSGLPMHNIKYIYSAKDSLVVLHQYLNADSTITDSVSLKALQFNTMNWNITQKQTSVDFQQTEVYNFYFVR